MTDSTSRPSPASNVHPTATASSATYGAPTEIWIKGICQPNPGPGAWVVIWRQADSTESELSGFLPTETTNNRMELTAAIHAMAAAARPLHLIIHTNSEYLSRGLTRDLDRWKRNDWMTAARKPVLNRDLWELMDVAQRRHKVECRWVQEHAGDEMMQWASDLASDVMDYYLT